MPTPRESGSFRDSMTSADWDDVDRLRDAKQTPALRAGCCTAPSKEACSRPPCPCNLGSWTVEEKNALAAQAHADAAAQRMERKDP